MPSSDDELAMSHKDYSLIVTEFLPFLTLHEEPWYRDRHNHKGTKRSSTCACCRTNAKWWVSSTCCGLCADAWSLSVVNSFFKQQVYEHGVTYNKWFWKWTAEHRRRRFSEGRWKGNGGQGYQPHAAYQARAPQPSTTDPDLGLWWSTAAAQPRPPSPPPLPEPVKNLIVAALGDGGQRPSSSTSMWTNEEVSEIRSCRTDGRLTELVSRLNALAVPVKIPIHVQCSECADSVLHRNEQGARRATFNEEAQVGYTCDYCNTHALEASVPNDKFDFEMMD